MIPCVTTQRPCANRMAPIVGLPPSDGLQGTAAPCRWVLLYGPTSRTGRHHRHAPRLVHRTARRVYGGDSDLHGIQPKTIVTKSVRQRR
jgi:hypothetical protein